MSRTQLAFNSGDLAFQEIITSRPNRNSATRGVSLNAVWHVTATFPSNATYPALRPRFRLTFKEYMASRPETNSNR
jgi:hypothetical protein